MRIREAALKLGIPGHHLYYWKRTGLLSPAEDLGFDDLIRARFIYACRQRGLSLQQIRRSVEQYVERQSAGARGDWSSALTLYGPDLLLERSPEALLDTVTGQMYLPYGAGEAAARVVPFQAKVGAPPVEDAGPLRELERAYLAELESGDFRRISKALEAILKRKPDHVAALIEFGNLCFEFKKNAEALKYYEAALELDPDCVEGLYNAANIHFKEERYAAAIRYFQRCIELDPEFPEAYYNIGLLYFKLRYFESAIGCLKTYIQLDPESHWSDQARQYMDDMQSLLERERNFSLFADEEPATTE